MLRKKAYRRKLEQNLITLAKEHSKVANEQSSLVKEALAEQNILAKEALAKQSKIADKLVGLFEDDCDEENEFQARLLMAPGPRVMAPRKLDSPVGTPKLRVPVQTPPVVGPANSTAGELQLVKVDGQVYQFSDVSGDGRCLFHCLRENLPINQQRNQQRTAEPQIF
jgi:hypothetical protein